MKKLLLLPLILITLCSFAQNKNLKSGPVFPNPFQFTEVDTIQANKDHIFINAYEWMAKTFIYADDRIQMHEKEFGKLVGIGSFEVPITEGEDDNMVVVRKEYVRYIMSIDVENGKYKCTLSDFASNTYGNLDQSEVFGPNGGGRKQEWAYIKQSAMSQSAEIFKSLETAIGEKD